MQAPGHFDRPAGVNPYQRCINSAVGELFDAPFIETSVNLLYRDEYTPTVQLVPSSTEAIFNTPISEDYTCLDRTFIEVKLKLTTENGGELPDFTETESVGLEQFPLSSIFSHVEHRINGEPTTENDGMYPFSSYLLQILSFGYDARSSRLSLTGYRNESDLSDDNGFDGAGGFRQRCELTQSNKIATFIGPIFTPLTNQSRLILPLTTHMFTFFFANNNFALRSNSTTHQYKIKFESIKLVLTRAELNPHVSLEIEKKLSTKPALYPIVKPSIRSFYIPEGQKVFDVDQIFPSQTVPRMMLVCLNETTAIQGAYKRSPFLFQPFGIESLKINIAGKTFPSPLGFERINFSDEDPNYYHAYFALFDYNIKMNEGNGITLTEWVKSYTIFKLTLGSFFNPQRDHLELQRISNAKMRITFSPDSENEPLTCLVYSEWDRSIAITGKREILRDYI